MEADIVDGKIGDKVSYDVEFKGGKLIAKIDGEALSGVKGGAFVEVDAAIVLDALAKAIPGSFDDAVIAGAKKMLLEQKS